MVSVDTTTHGNVHRDTSELLESRACNGPLALATGKDLDGLTAMGTVKIAHVLDHAQDRHTHLLEQAHRATGVHARQSLRSSHKQYAIDVYGFQQCLLRFACARGKVEDQNIQLAP